MKNETFSSSSFSTKQENSNFYDFYTQAEESFDSYQNAKAKNFFIKAIAELPYLVENPSQELLAELYFHFGQANSRLGNYKEAIENYRLAEKYKFNEMIVKSKLGELHFKLGEYIEAADYCDQIIVLNSSIVRAYYNKGNILLNYIIANNLVDQDLHKQAIECYKKALEIEVVGYEEDIYQIYKVEKKEIPTLTSKKNGVLNKEIAKIITWKGNVALMQFNNSDEALANYDKALEIDNNCLEALIGKGYVLIEANCLGEALVIYNKALEIDNNYLEALIAKQQILIKLERFKEVIEICDKIFEILPEHEEVLEDKIKALLIINQDNEGYKSEEENSESLLNVEKITVDFSYGIYNKEDDGYETDEFTQLGLNSNYSDN